jgi:hypothetical protein
MMRPSIGSLLLASTFALAGCEGGTIPSTSDSTEAEESFTIARIDPALLGTYRADSIKIGGLTLLALKSDNTFHYGMAIVCVAQQADCGPAAEDGVYRVINRRDTNILELYSKKEILRARFEYELIGDSLRMRRTDTGGGEWRSMTRSEPAWCGAASDCGVQNLEEGTCEGDWSCELGACVYRCSESACEVQGGQCQAKGGCSPRTVGNAPDYVCKDAAQECCVDVTEAPSCLFEGSEHEGWYSDGGQALLCNAKCAGAALRCSGVSATSEGYHAMGGEGCDGTLVLRGRCSLF